MLHLFLFLELNVIRAAVDGNQAFVKMSNTINLKAQFRDVITLWSTIEGFASFRNAATGSVFIQSLCRKLQDFGGRIARDLYEAHLDVTQEVTDKLHKVLFAGLIYLTNQTPLYKSTATRKVAFQKKWVKRSWSSASVLSN